MEKKYFVYKYTFPNKKIYIGKSQINGNRYKNKSGYKAQVVYRAMLKYPNFQAEILKYFDSEEECYNAEQEYIALYKSNNNKYGYNITSGGDGADPELMAKKINQYDLKGIFLRTWDSLKQAAEYYNIKPCSITNACKRRTQTCYHYQWRYYNDQQDVSNSKYWYDKRKIKQFNLDGSFVKTWDTIKEARSYYGNPKIHEACTGKVMTAAGYQWRFADSRKPVKNIMEHKIPGEVKVAQYDRNNCLVKMWNSIAEAARQTKIDASSIIANCKLRRKSAGGYIWKYGDLKNVN